MTSLVDRDQSRLALPNDQSKSRQLSRSPHPYSRRSTNVDRKQENGRLDSVAQDESGSSSDRGTEADDEKGAILRGLPAPPLRARKGLIGSKSPLDITPAITPLSTPPPLEDGSPYFFIKRKEKGKTRKQQDQHAIKAELFQKYAKRRRAEVVRRCTETVLLGVIGLVACRSAMVAGQLRSWKSETYRAFVGLTALYALYPIRSALRALSTGLPPFAALKRGFHVPSRFDPGPLLYPVFVPFFISASLITINKNLVVTNLIIGLSSVPSEVVSIKPSQTSMLVHWAFSLVPLLGSQLEQTKQDITDASPLCLQNGSNATMETCALLFPLHQTLLVTLKYLTTTSLDPAELHLLSAGLINILLFANSPQAQILKALLWLGSLHLFVFCRTALSYEIKLARIPAWKFARNRSPKSGLLRKIENVLNTWLPRHRYRATAQHDSDDEDYEHLRSARRRAKPNMKQRSNQSKSPVSDLEPVSTDNQHEQSFSEFSPESPIQAVSMPPNQTLTLSLPRQRRRSTNSTRLGLSSLTFTQAQVTSWIIAGYTYIATILIVLVSLRHYIGGYALHSQEPFGWALGYLFGNISQLRLWIVSNNWEKWIRLPEHIVQSDLPSGTGWLESVRQTRLGGANVRLILAGYCLLVLATGIGIVLRLGTVVEVDTRRKVFHGIMVAMMLPTIPIDPCFISLALVLILAIFLLLDLFRASQLPPISKPLTAFLAPYVDGRDYRGPVIVSHIFLLIGCAIPLWLSLAGVGRSGRGPWTGWEASAREVSMVSGVICVGMGDAAASLIGRRYGRTKWFWGGGKSLEGSLAFAVAVTIGLMASYLWLRIGGWKKWDSSAIPMTVFKAMVAASGASLLESVLTAANDNVVVPIGLWLLVRGLDI